MWLLQLLELELPAVYTYWDKSRLFSLVSVLCHRLAVGSWAFYLTSCPNCLIISLMLFGSYWYYMIDGLRWSFVWTRAGSGRSWNRGWEILLGCVRWYPDSSGETERFSFKAFVVLCHAMALWWRQLKYPLYSRRAFRTTMPWKRLAGRWKPVGCVIFFGIYRPQFGTNTKGMHVSLSLLNWYWSGCRGTVVLKFDLHIRNSIYLHNTDALGPWLKLMSWMWI